MVEAESVETALQLRLGSAAPIAKPKTLRVRLPAELRLATLHDLTPNVEIKPGEVRVTGANTVEILEGLALLATILQNDLDSVAVRLEPPPLPREDADVDEGLREMLRSLRTSRIVERFAVPAGPVQSFTLPVNLPPCGWRNAGSRRPHLPPERCAKS